MSRVSDTYRCMRCEYQFEALRPQRGGQWTRQPRIDPLSGIFDPEHGVITGGDPGPDFCPKCGNIYFLPVT